MVKGSLGIGHKALKRSDIKQSDTHMHKHFNQPRNAASQRQLVLQEFRGATRRGNKQVGSLDLWGRRFQRNGFMEMRVKGSIGGPLIWGR